MVNFLIGVAVGVALTIGLFCIMAAGNRSRMEEKNEKL